LKCSIYIELSGTIVENDYKYLYEAFAIVIDDPLKVGFLFNPLRAGEGFCVCLISLVAIAMEFCPLKKPTLCFSTN